jgi:hypothetical protein
MKTKTYKQNRENYSFKALDSNSVKSMVEQAFFSVRFFLFLVIISISPPPLSHVLAYTHAPCAVPILVSPATLVLRVLIAPRNATTALFYMAILGLSTEMG